MRRIPRLGAVALMVLFGTFPGLAASKKKPTPTPTPAPLLRAAGSCLAWIPGKHLVLAEVGTTGRVFRVDASTEIGVKIGVGSRLRVLYEMGPEGPVARKILPGPVVSGPTPTPVPGRN
ncbi:MAG TPA: hypothetical protein VL084_06215 [Thermoanaerobaculia bacterium]|nr:hypothetical protein [Thermoanaerobaculia bacterium]